MPSDGGSVSGTSPWLSKHPPWSNNQVLRVMLNTIGAPTNGAKRNDAIGIVRPRIALQNPGDPGPAHMHPLQDFKTATSQSASPEASGTEGSGAQAEGANSPAVRKQQRPPDHTGRRRCRTYRSRDCCCRRRRPEASDNRSTAPNDRACFQPSGPRRPGVHAVVVRAPVPTGQRPPVRSRTGCWLSTHTQTGW